MSLKQRLHGPAGKPIAYYPNFARHLGGVKASLLLCQLIYWNEKGRLPDGWVYKTRDELEDETGLTVQEQRTALKKIAEYVEVERAHNVFPEKFGKMETVNIYRLNVEKINLLIDRMEKQQPTVASNNRTVAGNNPVVASNAVRGSSREYSTESTAGGCSNEHPPTASPPSASGGELRSPADDVWEELGPDQNGFFWRRNKTNGDLYYWDAAKNQWLYYTPPPVKAAPPPPSLGPVKTTPYQKIPWDDFRALIPSKEQKLRDCRVRWSKLSLAEQERAMAHAPAFFQIKVDFPTASWFKIMPSLIAYLQRRLWEDPIEGYRDRVAANHNTRKKSAQETRMGDGTFSRYK
jgi:hypothetical protein